MPKCFFLVRLGPSLDEYGEKRKTRECKRLARKRRLTVNVVPAIKKKTGEGQRIDKFSISVCPHGGGDVHCEYCVRSGRSHICA